MSIQIGGSLTWHSQKCGAPRWSKIDQTSVGNLLVWGRPKLQKHPSCKPISTRTSASTWFKCVDYGTLTRNDTSQFLPTKLHQKVHRLDPENNKFAPMFQHFAHVLNKFPRRSSIPGFTVPGSTDSCTVGAARPAAEDSQPSLLFGISLEHIRPFWLYFSFFVQSIYHSSGVYQSFLNKSVFFRFFQSTWQCHLPITFRPRAWQLIMVTCCKSSDGVILFDCAFHMDLCQNGVMFESGVRNLPFLFEQVSWCTSLKGFSCVFGSKYVKFSRQYDKVRKVDKLWIYSCK